jgi:lipopolysaccharide transport system permease protein
VTIPNFSAFLFIGIVAWNWFSAALLQSTTAILENRDLVRQPGFPAGMLPVVTVMAHLIHFLITLPILFGLLMVSDIQLGPAILWLPLVVLLQFLLSVALGYLAACLHVKFRDTQYLLGIALMLGFFLTPILYTMEIVPPQYLPLYQANPMAHLVEAYRDVLMYGRAPDFGTLGILTLVILPALAAFFELFRRASTDFADEI